MNKMLFLLALLMLLNVPADAAKSGCDYWDEQTIQQIDERLRDTRDRWLAIQPTAAQIQAAKQEEMRTLASSGYKNPGRMVAGMGNDFFVRRIRLKEYPKRYGDQLTDEELWIYCVDGRKSACATHYDEYGPPEFDEEGRLLGNDARVKAMVDEVRSKVAEFNLLAQITMFSFCACDGSDEAVALCKKARRHLFQDF